MSFDYFITLQYCKRVIQLVISYFVHYCVISFYLQLSSRTTDWTINLTVHVLSSLNKWHIRFQYMFIEVSICNVVRVDWSYYWNKQNLPVFSRNTFGILMWHSCNPLFTLVSFQLELKNRLNNLQVKASNLETIIQYKLYLTLFFFFLYSIILKWNTVCICALTADFTTWAALKTE